MVPFCRIDILKTINEMLNEDIFGIFETGYLNSLVGVSRYLSTPLLFGQICKYCKVDPNIWKSVFGMNLYTDIQKHQTHRKYCEHQKHRTYLITKNTKYTTQPIDYCQNCLSIYDVKQTYVSMFNLIFKFFY